MGMEGINKEKAVIAALLLIIIVLSVLLAGIIKRKLTEKMVLDDFEKNLSFNVSGTNGGILSYFYDSAYPKSGRQSLKIDFSFNNTLEEGRYSDVYVERAVNLNLKEYKSINFWYKGDSGNEVFINVFEYYQDTGSEMQLSCPPTIINSPGWTLVSIPLSSFRYDDTKKNVSRIGLINKYLIAVSNLKSANGTFSIDNVYFSR
jgi:hypothetical protein